MNFMLNVEKRVFEVLKTAAMQKEVMSGKEAQVIATAMRNAITFDRYLKQAKRKGVITENEKEELLLLSEKIYEGAMKQAIKDDFITPEECVLLVKLSEFLEDLVDEENSKRQDNSQQHPNFHGHGLISPLLFRTEPLYLGNCPSEMAGLRNGVKTPLVEWMTPKYPSDGHPTAPHCSVTPYGLTGIFGTGWVEATSWCKKG